MKKIRYVLAAVIAAMFCLGLPVSAANSDKVVDRADLLTDQEEEKLEEQFAKIAEKYQCDVAVVTVDSCGNKSPMNFTDDYYESNGYGCGAGKDGLMLMISMEERDWWITTMGDAIRIFTDYGLEQLEDQFIDALRDGDYYKAFRNFGQAAEAFMEEARKDRPYDVDHTYRKPMSLGVRIGISLAVGAVLAVLVFAGLFAQLKSVKEKREARDYVRAGSFHVTRANDLFLYRTVHRRKIEQQPPSGGGGGSTIHTTSSGGSAGGRGGKF